LLALGGIEEGRPAVGLEGDVCGAVLRALQPSVKRLTADTMTTGDFSNRFPIANLKHSLATPVGPTGFTLEIMIWRKSSSHGRKNGQEPGAPSNPN
jgi:hypothetical protein